MSGGSRNFFALNGSAYRNRIAGIGFAVGSLSMVGIPIFSGFVSKLLFAKAAIINPTWKMFPTVIVLAVSTILNAIYFLKTVIRIYTPEKQSVVGEKGYYSISWEKQKLYTLTIILFVILNLILGMNSQPIIHLIETGLANFA